MLARNPSPPLPDHGQATNNDDNSSLFDELCQTDDFIDANVSQYNQTAASNSQESNEADQESNGMDTLASLLEAEGCLPDSTNTITDVVWEHSPLAQLLMQHQQQHDTSISQFAKFDQQQTPHTVDHTAATHLTTRDSQSIVQHQQSCNFTHVRRVYEWAVVWFLAAIGTDQHEVQRSFIDQQSMANTRSSCWHIVHDANVVNSLFEPAILQPLQQRHDQQPEHLSISSIAVVALHNIPQLHRALMWLILLHTTLLLVGPLAVVLLDVAVVTVFLLSLVVGLVVDMAVLVGARSHVQHQRIERPQQALELQSQWRHLIALSQKYVSLIQDAIASIQEVELVARGYRVYVLLFGLLLLMHDVDVLIGGGSTRALSAIARLEKQATKLRAATQRKAICQSMLQHIKHLTHHIDHLSRYESAALWQRNPTKQPTHVTCHTATVRATQKCVLRARRICVPNAPRVRSQANADLGRAMHLQMCTRCQQPRDHKPTDPDRTQAHATHHATADLALSRFDAGRSRHRSCQRSGSCNASQQHHWYCTIVVLDSLLV
jgi:hypothetical protein